MVTLSTAFVCQTRSGFIGTTGTVPLSSNCTNDILKAVRTHPLNVEDHVTEYMIAAFILKSDIDQVN